MSSPILSVTLALAPDRKPTQGPQAYRDEGAGDAEALPLMLLTLPLPLPKSHTLAAAQIPILSLMLIRIEGACVQLPIVPKGIKKLVFVRGSQASVPGGRAARRAGQLCKTGMRWRGR